MSNLLDRSSLVLTPTAYNNGEALCIKPDDASGDFTFSRNSAATRVNAQGLVENVQILSSNLVQNGDFSEEGVEEVSNGSFTNGSTDWTLIGTATITENQANIVTASAVTGISQSNILTIGKSYKLSYNIVSNNNGGLKISGNEIPSVVGNNIYYFEASAASLEILRNSGITDISITNISVKEVGQNWTLGTGFSIGEDVAIYDDSANGNLSQSKTFTSGKKYNISFEIKSGSGSIAFLSSNGVTTYVGYATYGIGTHSVVFDYTTGSGFGVFASSFLGGAFSISNISVIEITEDTNLPRINYEGFSYQDALGSELVTNGDFATDSDWDKTSAVIENGKATLNIVNSAMSSILQSSVMEQNKTYKITFDAILLSGTGNLTLARGGNNNVTNSLSISQSGTFSQVLKWVSSDTTIGIKRSGGGDFSWSIDNVSVKEYLGQEVVPDSGCGSWLFEPQSSNLITQSELLNLSLNNKVDTTITDNFGVSPSGQLNSSRIQFADATSFCYGMISISTTHTASVYVKGTSGETIRFGIGGNVTTGDLFTFNGLWQRIEYTTANATQIFFSSYGGATATDFEAFGLQLEEQSYSTSYIPTSGSQVTRNRDVCTNGGSLASINSTEGTLYFEGSSLVNGGTSRIISLSDGTNNNLIYIRFDFTASRFFCFARGGGGSYTLIFKDGINQTDNNKVALVWDATNFKIWINGSEQNTRTINSLPIAMNTLNFTSPTGSDVFFGKTKCVAVWKEALSDAELTELTTI